MMSVRLPRLALLPLLLLALAGCDDGTSPGGELGDLDPNELARALNALVEPLTASSTATANLNVARQDLTEAGVDWRTFESPFRARARDRAGIQPVALDASVPALPISFPPDLLGETFVFDFEAQQWEVDETRADAPADGVRLIWYTVDGSGRIRFPLEERGYIDLTPGTGAGEAMDMLVVETGDAADVVLLDFVQNRASTDDAVQVEWFTANGYYSDGALATDFDIASEETVNTDTDDRSYDLEITLENSDTRYSMRVDGSQTGAGEYEDRITSTAIRGGATTILEVVFRGSDEAQEEASGTLLHNGTLIANLDIEGSDFSFSTPDGAQFSAAQSNALNALFTAMTRNGFQVLLNLPLILP